MLSSRELKDLVGRLHRSNEADFKRDYQKWREKWQGTINHKSLHKDGKMHYTHRRLRAAMNSLNFYLPYLFTYQQADCKGMPNRDNKIDTTRMKAPAFKMILTGVGTFAYQCTDGIYVFPVGYLRE